MLSGVSEYAASIRTAALSRRCTKNDGIHGRYTSATAPYVSASSRRRSRCRHSAHAPCATTTNTPV
jgi:hypothetical protein